MAISSRDLGAEIDAGAQGGLQRLYGCRRTMPSAMASTRLSIHFAAENTDLDALTGIGEKGYGAREGKAGENKVGSVKKGHAEPPFGYGELDMAEKVSPPDVDIHQNIILCFIR